MLINDKEQAERLARAIAADLILYNADKIQGLELEQIFRVLDTEIEEGRALFQERVEPNFHSWFDLLISQSPS